MKEAMFEYLMTISYIIDTHWNHGWIRWLFYAALVVVFFKTKDSRKKHVLFWYPVIVLCVLTNPLTIYISGFLVEKNTYAYLAYMGRQYSLIPIFYTVAYVSVLLIQDLPKGRKLIATGLICVCLILCGSGFVYRNAEYPYHKSENAYKIPNDLIQMCDYMDSIDDNPIVAMPAGLSYMARQYDASLHLLVGTRDGSTFAQELDAETPNVEYILENMKENGGEFMIVRNLDSVKEVFAEKGYEPGFETPGYLVYQCK